MIMLPKLINSTLIIFLMITSGCASLLDGRSQQVKISTHPQAEIYINDRFAGQGSRTLLLSRNQAHQIQVSLGDCEQIFMTQKRFNKKSLMGLFIDFGLISIPLDFSTGAAWHIVPSHMHIQPPCMISDKN